MRFPIPFTKMSGTGNDFILIDNRSGLIGDDEMVSLAVSACRRRQSVGADGLILIEDDPELDFAWRFFNSDGSEAEMCGNGARCAARFAWMEGMAPPSMTFRTIAGPIRAEAGPDTVKVQLTPYHGMDSRFELQMGGGDELDAGFIDTGVPHTVVLIEKGALEATAVQELGREIRFNPQFAPAGTNVNFVEVVDDGTLRVRTYERGVEGETLACGTGAVAAAAICRDRGEVVSPVDVLTRGGDRLRVFLDTDNPDSGQVFLEGSAHVVYRGQLTDETLKEG